MLFKKMNIMNISDNQNLLETNDTSCENMLQNKPANCLDEEMINPNLLDDTKNGEHMLTNDEKSNKSNTNVMNNSLNTNENRKNEKILNISSFMNDDDSKRLKDIVKNLKVGKSNNNLIIILVKYPILFKRLLNNYIIDGLEKFSKTFSKNFNMFKTKFNLFIHSFKSKVLKDGIFIY